MSKSLYKALSGSPGSVMCFCSCCEPKVKLALKFFDDIEEKYKSLENKLHQLEDKFSKSLSVQTSENNTGPNNIQPNQTKTYASVAGSVPTSEQTTAEKKFNVIVYGIAESPSSTTRSERIQNDLSKVVELFSKIDCNVGTNAIKDHFRLGKYQSNHQRPRPILVKFLRSSDALNILLKKRDLQTPITIKPDMTKQERLTEQLLLKQRWQLLQNGYDRKRIKIRRNTLIVDNVLFAKLAEDKLVLMSTPTIMDSAPTLSAASTPQQMDQGNNANSASS